MTELHDRTHHDGRPLQPLGKKGEVRAMYENYPYPRDVVGGSLIHDVAHGLQMLLSDGAMKGKRVLDAGCGTGQRLALIGNGSARDGTGSSSR